MHWTTSLRSLYPSGKHHRFSLDRTVEGIKVRHRLSSRERNPCLETNTVVRAFVPCTLSLNCSCSYKTCSICVSFGTGNGGLVRSTADLCLVAIEFKY